VGIKHSLTVSKQYQSAVHGDLICRKPRTPGLKSAIQSCSASKWRVWMWWMWWSNMKWSKIPRNSIHHGRRKMLFQSLHVTNNRTFYLYARVSNAMLCCHTHTYQNQHSTPIPHLPPRHSILNNQLHRLKINPLIYLPPRRPRLLMPRSRPPIPRILSTPPKTRR
jgi:hypothetical protein